MSLDGFIAGPNDDVQRLPDWVFGSQTDRDTEVLDEAFTTAGAIVIGGRIFNIAEKAWGDDDNINTGCWEWPGGGYESTLTSVK